MASEPDDKTLLEFVARFVGWTKLQFTESGILLSDVRSRQDYSIVPDYLSDLNAWHREVWPKVISLGNGIDELWQIELEELLKIAHAGYQNRASNADARQRCLALYRALDGKLPRETT